jgi:hypothetical protein
MKKATIGSAFGIGAIIGLVILFRVSILVKNIIFPPKIEPPNHAYDILPAIQFPKNVIEQNLTYSLNTISGELPDFPDRLNVFPIIQPEPNLLNLDHAKEKALAIGFITLAGNLLPETALGDSVYQWKETSGINRTFTINTVNFNFNLESDYLTSITVLGAQYLSSQENAIQVSQSFLDAITLFPDDIDLTKTNIPNQTAKYITYPQLFSVKNGELIPTTSLSKAQIIRVDLYQKDMEYELNTGVTNDQKVLKRVSMKLPIMYPHPPYSTMNFFVGSGQGDARVVAANFSHQEINIPAQDEEEATYALKPAADAFKELKDGKAYIASYNGSDTQILIKDVYLAYYLGETAQGYLMPVYVFEGENGFFAYVSAVSTTWIQ